MGNPLPGIVWGTNGTATTFTNGEVGGNTGFTSVDGQYYTINAPRDGLDLMLFTQPMNTQLQTLETNMTNIMNNANLSDVQKQFSLQQAMNSWSAIAQGMTNMIKAVSDVNKSIVRNID